MLWRMHRCSWSFCKIYRQMKTSIVLMKSFEIRRNTWTILKSRTVQKLLIFYGISAFSRQSRWRQSSFGGTAAFRRRRPSFESRTRDGATVRLPESWLGDGPAGGDPFLPKLTLWTPPFEFLPTLNGCLEADEVGLDYGGWVRGRLIRKTILFIILDISQEIYLVFGEIFLSI